MKFQPKRKNTEKVHIGVDFPPDKYASIKKEAQKNDLSIKEFCRQAISYAMGWK